MSTVSTAAMMWAVGLAISLWAAGAAHRAGARRSVWPVLVFWGANLQFWCAVILSAWHQGGLWAAIPVLLLTSSLGVAFVAWLRAYRSR